MQDIGPERRPLLAGPPGSQEDVRCARSRQRKRMHPVRMSM
jgi:hypothetical protein